MVQDKKNVEKEKEVIQILLIEDDLDDVLLLKDSLAEAETIRVKLTHAARLSDGLKQIAEQIFDVILLDLNLPDSRGLETLSNLQRSAANIPIVIISGLADDHTTLEAVRHGAQDFLVKGEISGRILARVLRYAIERKQAEDALARSEAHYRQIIETAQEGIWTIDADNRTTLVNQRLADMLGYTIEEMIQKSIYEFTDDEGKAIGAKSLENRRLGINEQLDFKYIRKDGSPFWAIIETSSLLDQNGKYIGALAMLTDITQRKQADLEMRQRLSELEVLYQSGLTFSQLVSPKAIAKKMIDLLDQKMDWHHTAIRLYNSDSRTLELLVFNTSKLRSQEERETIEERLNTIQRPDQGFSGWVIQHGEVVRSNDLKNDPRYVETFPGLRAGLYVPIKIGERVIGVISIESERTDAFSESDERLTMTLAAQAGIAINNALLLSDLKASNTELSHAYDATIAGWSGALDLRDKETEGHSRRVTEMTLKLARAFGLSTEELVQIRRGALLHDIGKMGIPDAILLKPGKLTDEEWVMMRKHPEFAYNLLAPIAYLRSALDIPYCHHEKWDGTGYPRGLKGNQIPLAARIFAVVDVWDALSSDRPYRPAWTKEKVREHIRSLSGTHFDPQVIDVLFKSNILDLY
jgi:PAS domain S-box-containing protein